MDPEEERGPHGLAAVGEAVGDAVESAARTVDDLVAKETRPASDLPGPESRRLPVVGALFAVCAALLVPWVVYIAFALPQRELSPNYDLAWAGFDVMLLASLIATALSVLRRSRFMPVTSAYSAALLVTDAWFDTVTAPMGWGLVQAVAMTVLVEVPLASICVWVALHATDLAERRIEILATRRNP